MNNYHIALLGDSLVADWGPECPELLSSLQGQFKRTRFAIDNHGVPNSRAGYATWRISNDYVCNGHARRCVSYDDPNLVVVESFAYTHAADGPEGLTEYRDVLKRMFDEIVQTTGAVPILLLTAPPLRDKFVENVANYYFTSRALRQRMADNVVLYLKEARSIAADERWPVADVYAEVDKRVEAGEKPRRFINQSDNLHLSRYGYRIQAEILMRTIDELRTIKEVFVKRLKLRYGREGLALVLPDDLDAQVLHLNPLPPLENDRTAVEASLRSPIGSRPLEAIARGRESACIVISDVTRPVPNEKLLTPLLACLHDCGIPEDKITLLVATGLHRPNEGAELEEMIGARIKQKYRVINHNARDAAAQTVLGEVAVGDGGRAVRAGIDSIYVQSDLKITTALIEPHLLAGYSGGRKLVCPGIASAETILQFHSEPMIGHPAAYAGNLRDNPVHIMSRAVAGMAGVDFICNVTLDEGRRITGVFSGDLDAAHQQGIAHVDLQSKVQCEPADIVVTTAAGYPLDTTLYQCIKGMVGALPAIKQGGTMIVCGSCSQGMGGAEFAAMCASLRSPEEFIDRIRNNDVVIDQWQLQTMMQVLLRCEVMFVTDGLPAHTLRECLLTPMPTVTDALEAALKTHGNGARVVVIPEGPYVTPVTPTNGSH